MPGTTTSTETLELMCDKSLLQIEASDRFVYGMYFSCGDYWAKMKFNWHENILDAVNAQLGRAGCEDRQIRAHTYGDWIQDVQRHMYRACVHAAVGIDVDRMSGPWWAMFYYPKRIIICDDNYNIDTGMELYIPATPTILDIDICRAVVLMLSSEGMRYDDAVVKIGDGNTKLVITPNQANDRDTYKKVAEIIHRMYQDYIGWYAEHNLSAHLAEIANQNTKFVLSFPDDPGRTGRLQWVHPLIELIGFPHILRAIFKRDFEPWIRL